MLGALATPFKQRGTPFTNCDQKLPFASSKQPQRRSYTRDFNAPEHDPKWNVLNKPYKPTYQREKAQTKRKVALKVAYTGTGYYGSQKLLDGLPTIEGTVEQALYDAGMIMDSNFGHLDKIGWSRSSRTDKGVHSLATIFGVRLEGMWTRINKGTEHFVYDIEEDCYALPEKINAHLPSEIRVLAAAPVVQHFDARKACIHRHYEYLIPAKVLEGSAYDQDPAAFARMLNMFLGRHHWHNFGQIERRSGHAVRRNRREDEKHATDLEESEALGEERFEEEIEGENVRLEENISIKHSERQRPSTRVHAEEKTEPSLLNIAPRSGDGTTTRPSLYGLEEMRAQALEPQPQKVAKQQHTSHSKRDTQPQFKEAALFRESNGMNMSSEEGNSAKGTLRRLSPVEVAALPLDDHLSQDAFFRTISAASHDEVHVQGERYVRLSLQGDSFLLHQVRRMVGALILAARGIYSEEVLLAAIDSPFRILTPRAPSQGLLLRDARFLDLNFNGRDTEPANQFARQFVYPHMHQQWKSCTELETDDEKLASLRAELQRPLIEGLNPDVSDSPIKIDDSIILPDTTWHELISTTPIPEVRDIIPGFDEWLAWHNQSGQNREIKRTERRAIYEKRRKNGRPLHAITTRKSF
jgi:tRNA pseudouridine(38-40) synthase